MILNTERALGDIQIFIMFFHKTPSVRAAADFDATVLRLVWNRSTAVLQHIKKPVTGLLL